MTQALIAPFGRSVDGLAGTWPRGRSRAVRARAREPELWERRAEPYPGAVVLDDLPDAVGDAAATERIVARFAATRLVLLALRGDLDAAAMADERAIARSGRSRARTSSGSRRARSGALSSAWSR
jgi:hypothetical protein